MTKRYFQVYNKSTQKWVKYDKMLGKIVGIKEDGRPYENVAIYKGGG